MASFNAYGFSLREGIDSELQLMIEQLKEALPQEALIRLSIRQGAAGYYFSMAVAINKQMLHAESFVAWHRCRGRPRNWQVQEAQELGRRLLRDAGNWSRLREI